MLGDLELFHCTSQDFAPAIVQQVKHQFHTAGSGHAVTALWGLVEFLHCFFSFLLFQFLTLSPALVFLRWWMKASTFKNLKTRFVFQTPIMDHDSHSPLLLNMPMLFFMPSGTNRYIVTGLVFFLLILHLCQVVALQSAESNVRLNRCPRRYFSPPFHPITLSCWLHVIT